MATLKIISNFEMSSQGLDISGKQGAATADAETALSITVTGTVHKVVGTLATATVITIYDDDDDYPADWDYAFFWADADCYIQIIAGSTNVVFKVEATVPFWIPGFDSCLPAANATLITGGTEPTLTDIDSIAIGNYSGSSLNYVLAIID